MNYLVKVEYPSTQKGLRPRAVVVLALMPPGTAESPVSFVKRLQPGVCVGAKALTAVPAPESEAYVIVPEGN